MLNPMQNTKHGAAFVAQAPGRLEPSDSVESRAMLLAGLVLVGAMSMQFAIFAIVLIGGRSALYAIGAAVSQMAYALWLIGGQMTVPLAACLLAAILCASLVGLHRSRWIALPQSNLAWTKRVMGVAASGAALLTALQIL